MRTKTILLMAVIALTLFGCKKTASTLVVAHRGASGHFTENSLEAVRGAIELKSDAVEVDIWRTTDDSLIVHHDRHTARLTNDSLIIPEASYAQLNGLQLINGEKIPTLREVLEILPPKMKIFIEIKNCWEKGPAGEVFPMLSDLLIEMKKIDQAVFISFNIQSLEVAKQLLPQVPAYWLTAEKFSPDEYVNKALTSGIEGISVHHRLVDSELMAIARQNNIEVHAWTVNDEELAKKLALEYQISSITTDYPDMVRTIVDQ